MQNARNLLLLVILLASPVLAQMGTPPETISSSDAKAAAAQFDAKCMAGQWHEQVNNPFRWIFEVHGDKLKIWRTDGFVSGKFRRNGSAWKGDLKWGNGETWQNVLLTPTCDCDQVHTNQAWWFQRK